MGTNLNVTGRLFLSEVLGAVVLIGTLAPYLILSTRFNSRETVTYLIIVLVVAVVYCFGSYHSVRWLTRPIRHFVAEEQRAVAAGLPGASAAVVEDARVVALDLPIQFTANVLLRFNVGAFVTALVMLATGTLPFDRTLELWIKAVVGS